MEIPRGRKVSKVQIFKGKYGTKMEFPERGVGGGGFKLENLQWEGYGYFLEEHNIHKQEVIFYAQVWICSHYRVLSSVLIAPSGA